MEIETMEKLKITTGQTNENVSSRNQHQTGQKNETGYCVTHGEFNRLRELFGGRVIEQDCPTCHDENVKQKEKERKEAERVMQIDILLYQSNVPKRFKSACLDDFQEHAENHKTAKKTISGYLKSFQDRLENGTSGFLCGNPGTGKTLLGCIMVNYVIHQGFRAQYTTAWAMVQCIRQAYSGGGSAQTYIEDYVRPDLLVIDEIGVQSGSDDERNLLYQVIDGRYNNVKPTILISNSKNPVSDGYLDLRTIDRLKDGGGFSITFDGESQRG